jgi:hypothetical protein
MLGVELGGPAEEAIGHAAERVMHHVGAADLAEPAQAKKAAPPDRQTAVHQAIVDQYVGEAEGGHAGADAETQRRGERARELAADEDQHDRHRRVHRREHVVALEAAVPRFVVRTVDRPERAVPHAAVKHAGPRLHQRGDDRRDGQHDPEVRGEAHL